MPQGARGSWSWAVRTGLGAVLCAGAMGCMNSEKDRMPPPRIGANGGKQVTPPPGLPGIQPLPGASNPVGASARPGPPGYNSPYAGAGSGATGIQQTGGFATAPGTGQPPARTIGQPVNPPTTINPPAAIIPSTGPVGASGPLPAPSFDAPNTQSRTGGGYPAPPNLTEVGPIPPSPPGNVTSGSNYTPQPQPLSPPNPSQPAVYANGSVGVYQMK